MQLEKIISISGKPGLYQLVAQLKNGFIIEDITTRKKVSINNTSQVSLLDNIAMFTTDEEVPLFDVFKNIAEKNDYQSAISHKSSDAELREFMETALPNYDKSRVYLSDIKKLAQWYNLLHKADYISAENFVKPEADENAETVEKTELPETKATKKAAPAENKAAPKANTHTAKAAPKSTHRKQG